MENKDLKTSFWKDGHTLLEVMVVIGIFIFLFSAFARILLNSERTWQTGKNKLLEASQARRATDKFTALAREANPDWIVGGTHYQAVISAGNTRIDFYQPILNSSGNITSLKKITFKLNPSDSTQLLIKEGTDPQAVVATSLDSIDFACGCSGCTGLDSSCPVVAINVVTRKNTVFNWTTQVTMRNTNMAAADDVEVVEPAAGEF